MSPVGAGPALWLVESDDRDADGAPMESALVRATDATAAIFEAVITSPMLATFERDPALVMTLAAYLVHDLPPGEHGTLRWMGKATATVRMERPDGESMDGAVLVFDRPTVTWAHDTLPTGDGFPSSQLNGVTS